jgi:BASS family bile acid:Na+ symporter
MQTTIFVHGFALWVMLAAVAAFFWPAAFAWFKPFIEPALGLIMFGMGVTLTVADFRRVAEKPYAVFVGVAGQFIIMPFAAAFNLTGSVLAGYWSRKPPDGHFVLK